MSGYREWLRLDVDHAYHGSGGARWHAVPAGETGPWRRREGLLVRMTAGGLVVYAPAGWRAQDAPSFPLLFWIVFEDAQFGRYTVPAVPSGSVLRADSGQAVREETGAWRLHADERIGAAAVAGADAVPGGRPDKAPLLVRIAPGDLDTEDAPLRCVVRLEAVSAYWKYYLQGPLAERPVTIVDADDGIVFDRTDETQVGGRPAAVFLSDRPIALRERPGQRFQLRERAAFGDKVLMKRLPVARAAGCTRALVGGQAVLVSEIFLNL